MINIPPNPIPLIKAPTLDPKPETPNPKPLNPKPETPKLRLGYTYQARPVLPDDDRPGEAQEDLVRDVVPRAAEHGGLGV